MRRMRMSPMGRLAVTATAAFLIVVAGMGCGVSVSVPLFPVTHNPAQVTLEFWTTLPGGSYLGHLQNHGSRADHVSVEVWYADGAAESAQVVVPSQDHLEELHQGSFTVSPQVSNGESRYPRVGTVSWNGGTSPGTPRKPVMSIQGFYCYADSLVGL